MEIKKYRLTDICDFKGGSQPPKKEWSKNKKEGYVRMLQIRDFTQSHKDNVEYVKVSKSIKTCKLDDVLIGRYGASVGKILTGLEGAYNVAIMKAIPHEKVLSKKYLLALLKAPLFQNFILSVGVRAAQAGFNKDDLSKFYVYLPSLDNQKRIAKVLADSENLIQKRKESIELLDEFLNSTFLEMFGDPVLNNKGWQTHKLGDICHMKGGKAWKKNELSDEGIRIVRISNLHKPNFPYWHYKGDVQDRYLIKKGDLLFSWAGVQSSIDAYIYDNEDALLNQHIYNLVPKSNEISRQFIYYVLLLFLPKLRGELGGGVGQFHMKKADIYGIDIVFPNLTLVDKFLSIYRKTNTLKECSFEGLTELENFYGSISQKAFKGELDLSKVDISKFDELNMPETNLEDLSNEVNAEPVTIERLEHIIKGRFGYQEFSISQIEEILSKQGIDYTNALVKGFIKDLLSEEKIRTEYSGSTHQVIFKYNK